MYQLSYAEAAEDSQSEARTLERQALDRAVMLLQAGESAGPNSRDLIEALHFTRRLWNFFVEELANEDNALPVEVRASLISIGIWILKEAEAIRCGQSQNCSGIREICAIVRDGLM